MTTTQDQFSSALAKAAPRPPAPITVAYGDGIGPEIMSATLRVLEAAGASLAVEVIEIGEVIYNRGVTSGIELTSWDSLRRTKVFLKAPITTPQGGGFKSLNVTVRKTLGLFANVRPSLAYAPFVSTKHPDMDVVIVRENEEDLYAGIEHRQTDEVVQCLKLYSRPGCERIVRYAFEYATRYGRRKVTCFTKDNIMKITDGLFHEVFNEVAMEYPDIEHEHWIIDIGAAMLADTPEVFDVVVVPNLYGDILSDVAAQLAGSVGLAGSANIGLEISMFEAIHGSAPQLAGRDLANPSGLMLAAVQMLVHIGQGDVATLMHNAWLRAIEDGIHTNDIYDPAVSSDEVGTQAFADAVIERIGQVPRRLQPVAYAVIPEPIRINVVARAPQIKELVGIDVFLEFRGTPDALGYRLEQLAADLCLSMISNRGQKVYPGGLLETICTDHWRCRFQSLDGGPVTIEQTLALLGRLARAGMPFIKTEGLFTFDGVPGYSLGQGE